MDASNRVLNEVFRQTSGKMTLIGAGGVFTGADAYVKIRAGASLIQLYTGMIFRGPWIAAKVRAELAELLKRDGYSSVGEAVGTDIR